MARRRGFTLVEIIIAAFVGTLLMGATYQLFTQGMRVYGRVQSKLDVQSAGVAAIGDMTRELRLSALRTLTVRPASADGPLAFSFRPGEGKAAVYTPGKSFVVYWFQPPTDASVSGTIWRRNVERDLSIQRLSASDLGAECAGPPQTKDRAFCAGMAGDLQLVPAAYPGNPKTTPAVPNQSDPALRITLVLKKHDVRVASARTTQTLTDVITTSIALRNVSY